MFLSSFKPVLGYSKKHPLNNAKNHEALLQHIMFRMEQAKVVRDSLVSKYRAADRTVHGYVQYSKEDRERLRDNQAGRGPKPVSVNLPLTAAKLDELTTFLLEVFWPNQGMHSAIAKRDEQPLANGVALLMNKHAATRQHYRRLSRFFFDALKYNLSALVVEWVEERGYKLKNTADKRAMISRDEIIWRGNDLLNMDVYNLFWDPAVHPVDVPTKGEFFAFVDMITPFALRKRAAGGQVSSAADRVLVKNTHTGQYSTAEIDSVYGASMRFWEEPPVVRGSTDDGSGFTDWAKFAGVSDTGAGVELLTYYGWMNPKEFGLSADDELQIWRIRVAQSQFIVDVEHLNNAHNMLPLAICSPNEDGLGLQQKSSAETLTEFQQFASFLMNVHQSAARKSLWGLTVYDPTFVNLADQKDSVAGQVPVQPAGYGKPIGDHVRVFNDSPRTEGTMIDVARVADMMEAVLPTNILKQVTDLERATNYQAAATVQGANRRSLKMARVIDDQAIKPLKRMQLHNVMQYMDEVEVLDEQGNMVRVDVAALRDMQLEYTIGEGLQGMDKLMTMSVLKDIIMAVIQSQQALQEVDMVALLDYWTSLLGDKTDLSQFKRKQPTMEQQNQMANDATARQVQSTEAALAAANQLAAQSTGAAG